MPSIGIRNYNPETDFEELSQWWAAAREIAPTFDMVPEESTYVLEMDGIPALSVSLILTNIREYCYVENFIGNPELRGPKRKAASVELLKYISDIAAQRGYKKLLCLGHRPRVKARYQELGFVQTLDGVGTFIKEL